MIGKKNPDGTYTYTQKGAPHTHVVDVRDVLVKERMKEAKQIAKTTNKPNREILAQSLNGLTEEVVAKMPKASTFAKIMRNQRQGINDYPKSPISLEELVLPDIRTTTNENFVLYDSGQHPTDRIIIFTKKQAMDFLGSCETLHMDGTVSSAPALFNQVYTIHGLIFFVFLFNSRPISIFLNHSLSLSKCQQAHVMAGKCHWCSPAVRVKVQPHTN